LLSGVLAAVLFKRNFVMILHEKYPEPQIPQTLVYTYKLHTDVAKTEE